MKIGDIRFKRGFSQEVDASPSKKRRQKWHIVTKKDDQTVMRIWPNWDIKPHGEYAKKGIRHMTFSCSCRPDIEIDEDLWVVVTHKSFFGKKRVKDSIGI